MRKVITLFIVSAFLMTQAYGQEFSLGVTGFPSVVRDYSPSLIIPHSGISLSYTHGRNEQLIAGVSFRSMPWGSEVSISEGLLVPLKEGDRFTVESMSKVYLGLPLFHNKFALSGAVSTEAVLRSQKYSRVFFSAGVRFNVNPSYQAISEDFAFLEGLFSLNFRLWDKK